MKTHRRASSNRHLALIDFIYEMGILNRTPRSGLWFLGTGTQSVAEHILRSVFIGFVLCELTPRSDRNRVVRLCLFHDLGEGRTGDLNYVHQRYGRLSEQEAIRDIAAALPFGTVIQKSYDEAKALTTLEAKLAKDADQLEWVATLREEEVKGNGKAVEWIAIGLKRLKTPAGRRLGRALATVHPDHWWFDKSDHWFVDRKPTRRKWRR